MKTKMTFEDMEMINGGYILDRGSGCNRYVLIDDITGECYSFSNRLDSIRNREKAETNSQQIISLEEYRNIFGREFLS